MIDRQFLIAVPGMGSHCALLALSLGVAQTAHAYVGPGPGITVVGALYAVLAAVFVIFAGILIWPIRVFLQYRKRRRARKAGGGSLEGVPAPTESAAGDKASPMSEEG